MGVTVSDTNYLRDGYLVTMRVFTYLKEYNMYENHNKIVIVFRLN